ncbi:Regulatory-associated protein of TOR 1 [Diplonema papillatum]|nr:Regulatory-associated protein of TOR 1 [Diplonema papillatum]
MKSSQRAPHDSLTETRVARELGLFLPFVRPGTWAKRKNGRGRSREAKSQDWKMAKDKTRTNHILLLLCLNVGVDPPDVMRVQPCAKLECWSDPLLAQSKMLTKGSEVIGELLQDQYRSLMREKKENIFCKTCLELSVDDLKYNLQTMRKKARDGRILIHYNGHGVPRVTQHGELWFFDSSHSQYVPVTITDIMQCVGSPAIYVLDCSNAGAILHHWYRHNFHNSRKKDILICACRRHEDLPMNPNLPADILTACLTTPIRASFEWYYHYSQRECLLPNVTKPMLQHLPGSAQDRKSPLGELLWIFTAVTDAIAWCSLSRELFNRLFRPRHDMLQMTLFRNFLLADRIMREAGCVPLSHPPLPETHAHPMWESWELALEFILSQLPSMLNEDFSVNPSYVYKPSPFFNEQLTAFELWVEFAGTSTKTPDQLPCIIQGLSSHQYRVRSLRLLARFLDLGEWAVEDALSCGVMPYVCKLLHQVRTESWIMSVSVTAGWMECPDQLRLGNDLLTAVRMQRLYVEKGHSRRDIMRQIGAQATDPLDKAEAVLDAKKEKSGGKKMSFKPRTGNAKAGGK